MRFEVENKFPVETGSKLVERLTALGATFGSTVTQVDLYLAHPARDFASTDEAFRMRRAGDENHLTYKGPRVDDATRTRREIELSIAPGEQGARDCVGLLEALGFRAVTEVRKERRSFQVIWNRQEVTGALDEVDELGSFVELEIVAEASDVSAAQRVLIGIAEELSLGPPERRSYLELLLGREPA